MKQVLLFLIILSILVSLPLYPVKKDTKLILDKLQKLEEMINNLEKKVTIISTEFSSMYKKINLVEEKVTAITRTQADMSQNKETLQLSLQFIKEELNDLKNSITKINDKLITLPTTINTTAQDSPATDQIQPPAMTQSPDIIYLTAYSDYLKKNYKLAIEGFKQFLKLYPDNDRADNSLYWIGECYYTQGLYQDAVNTFSELIDKYGEGDKITDSTLKKGYALIEMGREVEGINVLKELISKYPFSDEAKLAQQKIKEMIE